MAVSQLPNQGGITLTLRPLPSRERGEVAGKPLSFSPRGRRLALPALPVLTVAEGSEAEGSGETEPWLLATIITSRPDLSGREVYSLGCYSFRLLIILPAIDIEQGDQIGIGRPQLRLLQVRYLHCRQEGAHP